MAQGLQIWDSSGNLILDTTTRICKFIGTLSVGQSHTGSTQSGSISVPLFTQYGNTPFFSRIDGNWSREGYDAVFYVSGSNLHWTFPSSTLRPDQTVIYGIF